VRFARTASRNSPIVVIGRNPCVPAQGNASAVSVVRLKPKQVGAG